MKSIKSDSEKIIIETRHRISPDEEWSPWKARKSQSHIEAVMEATRSMFGTILCGNTEPYEFQTRTSLNPSVTFNHAVYVKLDIEVSST